MDRDREDEGRVRTGYGRYGEYGARRWRYGEPDRWGREFAQEQTMQGERYYGLGRYGPSEREYSEPAERRYAYGGYSDYGQPDRDLFQFGPTQYTEPAERGCPYGRQDYYGQPEWRFSHYGLAEEYSEPGERGYPHSRYDDYRQPSRRFGMAGEAPGPFAGTAPRNYRRFDDRVREDVSPGDSYRTTRGTRSK